MVEVTMAYFLCEACQGTLPARAEPVDMPCADNPEPHPHLAAVVPGAVLEGWQMQHYGPFHVVVIEAACP